MMWGKFGLLGDIQSVEQNKELSRRRASAHSGAAVHIFVHYKDWFQLFNIPMHSPTYSSCIRRYRPIVCNQPCIGSMRMGVQMCFPVPPSLVKAMQEAKARWDSGDESSGASLDWQLVVVPCGSLGCRRAHRQLDHRPARVESSEHLRLHYKDCRTKSSSSGMPGEGVFSSE